MDRSRRGTGKQARAQAPQPPASSRLTFKPRPNRRRPESVWTRVPKPAVVADACGRALRRSLPVIAGATVLLAIGGTAWAGYRFVTTSPRFAITTIEVTGNRQVSDDELLASMPVRLGDNVFGADLGAVVSELHRNPWIEHAEAHRVLPHTIVVEVREHVPAAIVQLGGLYLTDADGRPFKRAELGRDDGAGLPIITGLDRNAFVADPAAAAASIRSALAALTRWRSESERPAIGEVHLDPHGSLTLVTYEHAISIQLGTLDDRLGQRMLTFDATWAELSASERARTRAIHLDTRPDHVTVAFDKEV